MTLLLDGEQVRGKNLKVTANMRIESDDLSGQTSNTDSAHKGFKPKTLAVNLQIPFVDSAFLRNLMRLAEGTGSGGQLNTYRVVNVTASAFGVRQVEFTDGVSAREDDTLRAWLVQFTLSEKLSNPERVETRRAGKGVTQQGAPGQSVTAPGAGGNGEAGQELTGFEATLKNLDNYLGGVL